MKLSTEQMNIGLFHPQLMNRVAITHLLNIRLSNRVKHVGHLFDLFSANYSIVILVEPEILSVKYNPQLIATFIESVKKPIIIIPFYTRESNRNKNNVLFMRKNPKPKEIINCIREVEKTQSMLTEA